MLFGLLLLLPFLAPSEPLLKEEAQELCPCEIATEEIQTAIDEMYETAYTQSNLVGLAAPQVGIPLRIILVDTAATEALSPEPPHLEAFINPEILWQSEETTLRREGCFSTDRVWGIVPRSAKIILFAYSREGHVIVREYEDFVARIFQHEMDHLNGIRFPDRIREEKDLHWVEIEELPQYRIHWQNWPHTVSKERWQEIKGGE